MIEREKFVELINDYVDYNKRLDNLKDIIGYSAYDNPFTESYWKLFEEVIKAYFTEEAYDDIMWWLLEKDGNPDMKMWDKDKNEIPTETIDDLWNIVESNRI